MDFLLCAIGLVLIIEGIPYFAFPEKMKQMLAKIPCMPTSIMRAFGMVAVACRTYSDLYFAPAAVAGRALPAVLNTFNQSLKRCIKPSGFFMNPVAKGCCGCFFPAPGQGVY